MPSHGLTKMQKKFCLELVRLGKGYGNATKAAIEAGSPQKNAGIQAGKWLKLAKVQQEINRLGESIMQKAVEQEERALLEAVQVERHLDAIITSNLKRYVDENGNFKLVNDLTDEEAYAIAELTIIETPLGTQQKLKFHDKLAAIKAKMERLGLFRKDKKGNGTPIETYEERRKRLGLDKMSPQEAFDKMMTEWAGKKGYKLVKIEPEQEQQGG
jgi:hypothetical protein